MTEIDLSAVRGGMRDGYTCTTALFGRVVGGGAPGEGLQRIKSLRIPSHPFRLGPIVTGLSGAAAVYFGSDACK